VLPYATHDKAISHVEPLLSQIETRAPGDDAVGSKYAEAPTLTVREIASELKEGVTAG
jgi:hypothetical protein